MKIANNFRIKCINSHESKNVGLIHEQDESQVVYTSKGTFKKIDTIHLSEQIKFVSDDEHFLVNSADENVISTTGDDLEPSLLHANEEATVNVISDNFDDASNLTNKEEYYDEVYAIEDHADLSAGENDVFVVIDKSVQELGMFESIPNNDDDCLIDKHSVKNNESIHCFIKEENNIKNSEKIPLKRGKKALVKHTVEEDGKAIFFQAKYLFIYTFKHLLNNKMYTAFKKVAI